MKMIETPTLRKCNQQRREVILDKLIWDIQFENLLATKWTTTKRFRLRGVWNGYMVSGNGDIIGSLGYENATWKYDLSQALGKSRAQTNSPQGGQVGYEGGMQCSVTTSPAAPLISIMLSLYPRSRRKCFCMIHLVHGHFFEPHAISYLPFLILKMISQTPFCK